MKGTGCGYGSIPKPFLAFCASFSTFSPQDMLRANALSGVTKLYQPFEAPTERVAFLSLIRKQENNAHGSLLPVSLQHPQ